MSIGYVRRVVAVSAAALAALLLMVAGPSSARAQGSAADVGTVQDLGPQISQFLILDEVLGRDAAGNPMLYGTTYVVSNQGVYFFALDPVSGKIVKTIHMDDSWGSYSVTAAPDGTVYLPQLSPSGIARLWAYDPDTQVLSIACTDTSGEGAAGRFYGVSVSSWGKVYFGAYPSGHLWDYDPTTKACGDLGVAVPGHEYAKAVLALPGSSHRVLVGTGTPAGLTVFDVDTGTKTQILPASYDNYSFTYNLVLAGNDVLVSMVTPDQRLLRFDAQTLQFLGESPAQSGNFNLPVLQISPTQRYVGGTPTGQPTGLYLQDTSSGSLTLATADMDWVGSHLWPLDIGGTHYIVSIGSGGVFGRWNPATGEITKEQLDLPGSPTEITSLQQGPDGNIYGGTYETDSLFRWDPSTDTHTVLGHVAKGRTGEVVGLASARGKLYTGSYTGADLTVYDPGKPWSPGTAVDSNPRDLGEAGQQQYRPWQMATSLDGSHVYQVSSAAYGNYGGGLTGIDTATQTYQTWRGLAGDHNLTAIAAGPHEVYLGASNHADGLPDLTSDPPLVVFDTQTDQKVFETVPVAGAREIVSLVSACDGVVYGATESGQWFTFNPTSRIVTNLGAFPYGVAKFIVGPDCNIYGTTNSTVFRVDPANNSATSLASTAVGYWRALAFDHQGRLYWASGTDLMRLDVGALPVMAETSTTLSASRVAAHFGQPVTFTADVASRYSNQTSTPTGRVSFYLNGSANAVAIVPVGPDGTASFSTTGLGAGKNTIVAEYSGDARFKGSQSDPLAVTVGETDGACTITGGQHGAVTVHTGETVTICDASISGAIVVQSGGSVDVENSHVAGAIVSKGAGPIRVCGSTTGGSIQIVSSTAWVMVGDEQDACAVNTVGDSLILQHNNHGVQAVRNTVIGTVVNVDNSGSGPFPDDVEARINDNQ